MLGITDSDSTDLGPLMNRVAVAMLVLSALSVTCRFAARKIEKLSFWWDDWVILAALPWSWICIIAHIVAVEKGGFGHHFTTVPSEHRVTFFKMLYIVQVSYPISIAFIKWSMIAFYRRVFAVDSTKIPLYTLFATIVAWLIAVLLAAIFSCSPVEGFWMRKLEPVCINNISYYEGLAIPNIVTDLMIMLFPIPMIWQLNMPKSQKIALTAIFTIGGFIIVISSLRLVIILQSQHSADETWILIPLGIFNTIELAVGILLACLPSMRPLLRFILRQSMRSTNVSDRKSPALGNSDSSGSSQTYWKSVSRSRKKTLPMDDASFTQLNESQSQMDCELDEYGKDINVQTKVNADLELGVLSGVGEMGQGIVVKSETQWDYQNTR